MEYGNSQVKIVVEFVDDKPDLEPCQCWAGEPHVDTESSDGDECLDER
jgi:hypothetical protein